MTVVSEVIHPKGLSLANQRKIVILRDVEKLSFEKIAQRVRNLQGNRPSKNHVNEVYKAFRRPAPRRRYKYNKCGRRPWKLTKPVGVYLLKRLRQLRRKTECTAATLQRELARDRQVRLEECTIRKFLKRNGYHWLPRSQKRKYSATVQKQRLEFASAVVGLSRARLRQKLSLAMDGVVLTMPPADPAERQNFCRQNETHMYRKRSESAMPELAGDAPYGSQVPLDRALPLWAGISEGGLSIVAFHDAKKLTASEWVDLVEDGALTDAIQSLSPVNPEGPWHVLCDNETFLRAAESREAYKDCSIKLWQIPAKSPDLNPIENFWGWLRKHLRALDFKDLEAKRLPLSKAAFRERVRQVLKSQKAQTVAGNCARRLRKVCAEVVKKKGAAARS
jgi:transposase